MESVRQKWLDMIGYAKEELPSPTPTLISTFEHPEFHAELYLQKNGKGRTQRVLLAVPHDLKFPAPAVAVPFYFPEAMLGVAPFDQRDLSGYAGIEMMLHLVRRGYAVASADAYHLTYRQSEKPIRDFSRWQDAGEALLRDHPDWTGIGKLVYDTQLLIDVLAQDERVDADRIGIAGHSLGGKMAFYTGCLDPRVKAILASDFGFGWKQSNWNEVWYWGEKLNVLTELGMDHTELLSLFAPKPFCLLAGEYDNEESGVMMQRTKGYAPNDPNLKIINHASGHRPPAWALEEGYAFLDRALHNGHTQTEDQS